MRSNLLTRPAHDGRLAHYGQLLTSADSLAWSLDARRRGIPLPSCTRHKNCANCLRYALRWRADVLAAHPGRGGYQPDLFDEPATA